ncbi:unnamed protein product [Brassica oleracea]
MDLTRPSSGHDQTEDPTQIHHPEEEEHHESRASKMLGKVKAKAKKLKNRLTNHGIDGNEQDHDVVDEEEEDDESDEAESEKHVAPVNEVSNVRGYRTSQPESLTHPGENNVPAPEEIIPSETKDSTDYTGTVPEPSRDAAYEHEAPLYPVRTSDVSEREESRETHHAPLNSPVSLLSGTEDVTTPGGDGLLGGQREVNTDMPKRFEDDLSGESTYQSKIPYHTQQGSGEAGEDDHKKSGLGTELASESVTVFGGKEETGPRDDFGEKSHDFDEKIETRIGNDCGKPGTELSEDFPGKGHEFEQAIGSGIGEDNGAGKQGTERREDFLGKSYEFDHEIESAFGKDSPTRLPGDEIFPTRNDDMKVEIGSGRGLPTETDDHFSPEFSGPKERDDFDSQAEQTRYEAAEVKPTTYSEMIGSSTGYSSDIAGGQHESPMSVETVADKFTTDDENVKETASPVTEKLPFSGGGREADETERGEDKFVPSGDHLEEKLAPEEEDKAFSDMVAEKLNLGEEKQTKIKEEVAVEKIPSDKLPEEIEGGEAVQEEGKGGIVGTIKGVYNYWLGGTEEGKPKSPNSVEESSQPLSPSVGTKGFSDSGESGLGETGGTAGAVAVQKQL